MRYPPIIPLTLLFLLAGLSGVPAQTEMPADLETPQARRVTQATDVVNIWKPQQHLYLKGNTGVSEENLAGLEKWLDDKAPNWTVVLIESADGENYTDAAGQTYAGMDAVEHALGKGLPNLTAFGQMTDPRTREANGAFFVLFLRERKFSYFGSTAQDKRGLGEDHWQGNLDGPAIAAMRGGGRIVDAAKDTITHIEGRLSSAIAAEANRSEQEAAERERARAAEAASEEAAKEASMNRAKSELLGAGNALDLLEKESAEMLRANPNLTGGSGMPDLGRWRGELGIAQVALDRGDAAAATRVAAEAKSWAESCLKDMAKCRNAMQRTEHMKRRRQELAGHKFSAWAKEELSRLQATLEQASKPQGLEFKAYARMIAEAEILLQTAELKIHQQEMVVAAAQRNLLLLGSGALVLLLGAGWFLNHRRRGAMRECLDLLQTWHGTLGEKNQALLKLLDRSASIVGPTMEELVWRYKGETRSLGEQVIKDVDEILIMASCANRILTAAKSKVIPSNPWFWTVNLFSAWYYRATTHLLRDLPIAFDPAQGLEPILQGVQTKRDRLFADLSAYPPFSLPFDQLLASLTERVERCAPNLDTIESSLTSVNPFLKEVQETIDAARSKETEISDAEKKDGLLRIYPVFSEILPAAQAAQLEATEVALCDAVGALRHPGADAKRKSDDALALIKAVGAFRNEALATIYEDQKALAAGGRMTQWIPDALENASQESERLARMAMTAGVASEIQTFQENLEQFRQRVAGAARLNRACQEDAKKATDDTTALIEAARKELGTALSLPSDQVLHEKELDPSQRVENAIAQSAFMRTTLDQGDVAASQNALDAIERLTRQAREIVEATRNAFQEHPSLSAACKSETLRLEALLPEHEAILSSIEREYAPSVLLLGAGDPTHPNANGTIGDNLVEIRGHLASARDLWLQANQMLEKAAVMRSAEALAQAQSHQETARFRLEEIKEKQARLTATDAGNAKLLSQLASRNDELAPEVDDPRTMAPTRSIFDKATQDLAAARCLAEASRRDPFQAEQTLMSVSQGLDAVAEHVRCDRDLYGQAQASLETADGLLASLQRLSLQARNDRIVDSAAITRALDAAGGLAVRLANVRQAFAQPHNDWQTIDNEAGRIATEAGQLAAALRNELQEAESAMSAITLAAGSVRNAGGWAGAFGVSIFGSPGSDYLSKARSFLESGDYPGARAAAESARRIAEQALAEAEALVRRRRQEEEEREQEMRRRRRQEEQMRSFMHSSNSSRSHLSSGGISSNSRSSSSRSSSFSSGSGTSRSGW